MANYLVFPDDAEQGVARHFSSLYAAKLYAGTLAGKRNMNVRVWRENLKTGIMQRAATVRSYYATKDIRGQNPFLVHHSIGYPTKAQAEKAKRSLAARGGGPYKLSHKGGWWYVVGPKVANPDILDAIKAGDKVTILVYAGRGRDGPEYKPKTGRAVMRGPYGWVLNMGGAHGTPGIATPENVVGVGGKNTYRNPPAGVEAIPTKWTKATISTRGGQVQIRTGGRR
jgi:hypothetical protein